MKKSNLPKASLAVYPDGLLLINGHVAGTDAKLDRLTGQIEYTAVSENKYTNGQRQTIQVVPPEKENHFIHGIIVGLLCGLIGYAIAFFLL